MIFRMSEQLYNQTILRLAADGGLAERLAEADGSAVKVSPVCGSRVTADVRLDPAGQITAHGQEVRACALGQAAATLVSRHILGTDRAALVVARTELADWLAGQREDAPHWPGLDIFAPARPHRARHPSILLAFDAAIAAVDAAQPPRGLDQPPRVDAAA
jgi:NifU-like protein involved in Fe-S cluster formation